MNISDSNQMKTRYKNFKEYKQKFNAYEFISTLALNQTLLITINFTPEESDNDILNPQTLTLAMTMIASYIKY